MTPAIPLVKATEKTMRSFDYLSNDSIGRPVEVTHSIGRTRETTVYADGSTSTTFHIG